jgi:hypothetical protein
VRNTTNAPQTFDPGAQELVQQVDSNHIRTFAPTHDTGPWGGDLHGNTGPITVNPGLSVEFCLLYDVPNGVGPNDVLPGYDLQRRGV